MSRTDGKYIGVQVSRYRRGRGMSQQQLADLIGKDRTYISHIESGRRPVDSRALLYDLARELSVSVTDLTGQPYEPGDPQHMEAQATVAKIQQALIAEGSDVIPGRLRTIEELSAAADTALLLRMQNDYVKLGQLAPGVISDLHVHIGHGNPEALDAMTRVTFAVAMGMKEFGRTDLAWIAAQAARTAAAQLGDPVGIAAAEFVRSQVSLAVAATSRASRIAVNAAEEIDGGDRASLEIRGMLHLQSALCLTAEAKWTGDGRLLDSAVSHFAEARALADRVGEGRAYQLRFGPTNVAVWDLSLAIEREEPGRVTVIAETINEAELDTAHRRARFFMEQGRALVKARKPDAALGFLLRAEKAAPLYVRTRPVVRELTGFMLREDRRKSLSGRLGEFAVRVGATPPV
jgi:transcriptional regulator with XRE-family HTH domain